MWKLKDDSDCPVDFPGNWGYYNMDTQSLDEDDGTLIQESFGFSDLHSDWLVAIIQSENELKNLNLKTKISWNV